MFKDKIQYSISFSILSKLPIEIVHHEISPLLDPLSLNRISQTSKSHYSLFKNPPLKIAYLLKFVTKSDYDSVDSILEKNPRLLMQKAYVSDHCRGFENLTAFQYALWARDWQMWNIMLYRFQIEKQLNLAKQQLEELEAVGTRHGRYFNINPLSAALMDYARYCDSCWTYDECNQYWNDIISPLEKELPIYIAYNYKKSCVFEYLKSIIDLGETHQQLLKELKQILMCDNALNFCQHPIKPSFRQNAF